MCKFLQLLFRQGPLSQLLFVNRETAMLSTPVEWPPYQRPTLQSSLEGQVYNWGAVLSSSLERTAFFLHTLCNGKSVFPSVYFSALFLWEGKSTGSCFWLKMKSGVAFSPMEYLSGSIIICCASRAVYAEAKNVNVKRRLRQRKSCRFVNILLQSVFGQGWLVAIILGNYTLKWFLEIFRFHRFL